MTPLVGTVDGWRATVKTIRWSTLLLPATAAAVSLAVVRAVDPSNYGATSFVADAGLAFSALAVAFIADDPTAEAAPGTPVNARARLGARAAVMVPAALLGWLLMQVLRGLAVPGPAAASVTSAALAGVGTGATALGVAVLSARWAAVPSPGAAGIAVIVSAQLILQALPKRWLHHLPAAQAIWPVALVSALVVVAWATREPARS